MSTTSTPSRPPHVQWLIDSRPPSLTWARPSPPQRNQPQLDFTDQEPGYAEPTADNDRGVRMSTVKTRWAARPRSGLPDAQEWSAKLALAIIQALTGQRPVAQSNFHKDDLARLTRLAVAELTSKNPDVSMSSVWRML
jgi:hypothetical protein